MARPNIVFLTARQPYSRQVFSSSGLSHRKPSAQPQTDDPRDEDDVINSIIPHYHFASNQSAANTKRLDRSGEDDRDFFATANVPTHRQAHPDNRTNHKTVAENRTDARIDRVIEDAREA